MRSHTCKCYHAQSPPSYHLVYFQNFTNFIKTVVSLLHVPLDGSIYDKKYPNPKKLLQKLFQRFSVVFDVLNNILKI